MKKSTLNIFLIFFIGNTFCQNQNPFNNVNKENALLFSGLSTKDSATSEFFIDAINNYRIAKPYDKLIVHLEIPQDYIFQGLRDSSYSLLEYLENNKDNKPYINFIEELFYKVSMDSNIYLVGLEPIVAINQFYTIDKIYPDIFTDDEIKQIKSYIYLTKEQKLEFSKNSLEIQNIFIGLNPNMVKNKWDFFYIKNILGKVLFGMNYIETEFSDFVMKSSSQNIFLKPYFYEFTDVNIFDSKVPVTRIFLSVPYITYLNKGKTKRIINKNHKPFDGFQLAKNDFRAVIFNSIKNKFESAQLSEGDYYGNW